MKVGKNILMLYCGANDNDGSMAKLADLLENKKINNGHSVVKIPFNNYLAYIAKHKKNTFHEICFVGHSQFYNSRRRVIKVLDRTIGGYNLSDVITVLKDAILGRKIKSIKFYCCESATNIDTESRKDFGNNKVVIPFGRTKALHVLDSLKNQCDERVSTIAYIAARLWNLGVSLKIQGLEGYGYYTKEKPQTHTFSSEYYHEILDIEQTEEALADSSLSAGKLARKWQALQERQEEFMQNRVFSKKSAHKIVLALT